MTVGREVRRFAPDAHRVRRHPESPLDELVGPHARAVHRLDEVPGGAIDRDSLLAPGGAGGDRRQATVRVGGGPGVLGSLRQVIPSPWRYRPRVRFKRLPAIGMADLEMGATISTIISP